jgi:hypothetical protein
MGSACDHADIDRFMRSPEGLAVLDELQFTLVGRTIESIGFTNEMVMVGIELTLDNGNTVSMTKPEFDIEVLRTEFNDVLEREFYVDYPDRQVG